MYGFQDMIFTLQNWGVVDVILPFILIFTIVFAVMEQTGILGGKDNPKNRKYSMMIALVLAFAVVIPHVTGAYYYGFDAVEIINQALPQVGLLLVAIVMLLLTLGLWTGKKADGSKGIGKWFTLISGLIVIVIFIASMNTGVWQLPQWLWWIINSQVLALIIAILVFGIIIRFIAGDDEQDKEKKKREREERRKRRNESIESFLGGSD